MATMYCRRWKFNACWIPAFLSTLLSVLLAAGPACAGSPEPILFFGDHALPPYEFLEDDKPKGANVDIAHAIGNILGRPVEIRLLPWADAQNLLLSGEGHALTFLGKTAARELKFDFSTETLPVAFALFVRAGEEARFSTGSLKGKRIGVISGSLPEGYISTEHPDAVRVNVPSGFEGTRLLLRGTIDALAANQWSQLYLLRELSISGITSVAPFIQRTGNIAVRDGDAALLEQINGALETLKESGEFDRIIDRWSGSRVHLFSDTAVNRALVGGLGAALLMVILAAFTMRLRRQKQALAHEVDERRRIELELAESDRQKDEFISTMAHELRNPLAAIQYALEIQRLQQNPQVMERTRAVVERQVAQLVHLVNDLLDVSRITTGKVQLSKDTVDLAEVVDSVIESIRSRTDCKSLNLVVDIASRPLLAHADVARLTQVVSNLLDNAIKYNRPDGHIWVHGASKADTVQLTIRDDGVGIPPQMLDKVFEMFSQVDHARGRRPDGLGIGLALVRKFVELHGGTVEAYSEGEGRGTSLVVTLPAAMKPQAAASVNVSTDSTSAPARSRRLLVIEDNADNAESLRMLLEANGYEVAIANDGEQGIELAEITRPDALIVDIGLPGISGHEVARRIRASAWGNGAVLIALTGWGQDNDRAKSMLAGFDQHFTKPAVLAELQDALDRLLEQPKPRFPRA